jgi:methionyl-tRNA formyltransferase
MSDKMKVVFITQDEPYYIPIYLESILSKVKDDVHVIKVYALPPHLARKNLIQTVKSFLDYFGCIIFSYMILLRIYYSVSDFIKQRSKKRHRFHSVKLVCRKFGVSYSRINSVNTDETLAEIRKLKPDIIFSVASPQIFGKKIISIPLKGALNIHSSLLPNYRGLNANFWVLANGEKKTGVTIHYINPGIDDGDILVQDEIIIENDWSLHDLYLNVIDKGSSLIVMCFHMMQENTIMARKNDLSQGSYFSFPSRKDTKKFRALNKRFFRYY